jgi:hypothetical protein
MNKYYALCFFLLFFDVVHAVDCPQPHPSAAMTLLVSDKQTAMIDLKAKAGEKGKDQGVLSEVLKRLGYTTKESQEKFALEMKSAVGLDKNQDFNNMTVDCFDLFLYSCPNPDRNLFVLFANATDAQEGLFYFFRKKGERYTLITKKPVDGYSKYCDSFPEYYSFGGNDYISMVGCGGGTGVMVCSAEVYEVGNLSVKKILEYTFSGDNAANRDDDFNEFYQSGPISFLPGLLNPKIQVPFTFTFSTYTRTDSAPQTFTQVDLFKKSYLLNYNWSLFNQTYVLNPSSSGIESDIEEVTCPPKTSPPEWV